jgi:hypothetical protein
LIPESAGPIVGVSKKSKAKKGKDGKRRTPPTIDEVEPQPPESALSNQLERKSANNAKQSKAEKKSKNKAKSTADATNGELHVTVPAKEAKSRKNKSKKKKPKANSAKTEEPNDTENAKSADDRPEGTKSRFIVFIGMKPDTLATRF